MSGSFKLVVPGSSANLGPGFDVLGLALRVYLTVHLSYNQTNKLTINVSGEGADQVPRDASNLLISAATATATLYGKSLPSNLDIAINNEIPLGRGIGSSGAAIVAGALLANQVCNLALSEEQLLDAVVRIEGHPDNVTASLKGGGNACCAVTTKLENGQTKTTYKYTPLIIHPKIKAVVITPTNFELSTKKARGVLPQSLPMKDAIYNMQRLSLLLSGLATGSKDLIQTGIQDCLHQPYRAHLIPGLAQILELNNHNIPGLLGVCLSGAGPSILALVDEDATQVGQKIVQLFREHKIESKANVLEIDTHGAILSLVTN